MSLRYMVTNEFGHKNFNKQEKKTTINLRIALDWYFELFCNLWWFLKKFVPQLSLKKHSFFMA